MAGYRPGQDGWTPEDDTAYQAAQGTPAAPPTKLPLGISAYLDAAGNLCNSYRASLAVPAELTAAARDVLAERQRHKDGENWTDSHHDLYKPGMLARAGAAYADPRIAFFTVGGTYIWPFSHDWFKPYDARRNYVRAAALLLAEIERIDRQAAKKAQEKS